MRRIVYFSDVEYTDTCFCSVHPFFMKPQEKNLDAVSEGPFQWLAPLGPTGSCLHGINLQPKASQKVATFDLDGTVIKSSFATKSAAGQPPSWEWWRASVPDKLKELHETGYLNHNDLSFAELMTPCSYAIVLISNQGIKPAALKTWKEKIPLIGQAVNHFFTRYSSMSHHVIPGPLQLKDVPFRIMAATGKDQYRKPMPGMWHELERIFTEECVMIGRAALVSRLLVQVG